PAVAQMVAAVVIPMTAEGSRTIDPAPRKPTPVTIWAAMRAGSLLASAGLTEAMVKMAAPTQMSTRVRRPAGFSLRSRSAPTMAPQRKATAVSTISDQGAGKKSRIEPNTCGKYPGETRVSTPVRERVKLAPYAKLDRDPARELPG